DAAGLPPKPDQHVDGLSLAAALRGDRPLPVRTLYWHFPHYHGSGATPSGAILAGDYKLIEWFEDERRELYRLDTDPSERHDLSREDPGGVKLLAEALAKWRQEVGARMPRVNPEWR
ncbi:MAG: hypothetical protein R2752_15555, partial [Vicinamibacterales bacterium]